MELTSKVQILAEAVYTYFINTLKPGTHFSYSLAVGNSRVNWEESTNPASTSSTKMVQ